MTAAEIISAAEACGATVVKSGGAVVIVLASDRYDRDELLTLVHAAQLAATSTRVLREAIRDGELQAFGRQRDRAVKRCDLDAWIAARRVRVEVGRDDDLIDRRVRRLERQRGKAAAR